MREGGTITTPMGIDPKRHLRVAISDIVAPMPFEVVPEAAHVSAALDFISTWGRAQPLVIHCFAGVSRSTATAFAAACALLPEMDEAVLAQGLRDVSPTATPNLQIVRIADELLGRNGRMVNAITALGRGADCYEGVPFRLRLDGGEAHGRFESDMGER